MSSECLNSKKSSGQASSGDSCLRCSIHWLNIPIAVLMHFFPFEISAIVTSGRGAANRSFSLESESLRRFAGTLVTSFSKHLEEVAVSESDAGLDKHFSQLQKSGKQTKWT